MTSDTAAPTSPRQEWDETKSALLPDPTLPGRAAMHYPALDGMRGVAVLMVLFFHAFLTLQLPSVAARRLATIPLAGWVGVDLFFVLSGFLITGILIDSHGSPRHFRNFYARRLLRIAPLYYLLLIVIFIVLPRFMPFDTPQLRTLFRMQGWVWTYLMNIGFIVHGKAWALTDQFDITHLWSLAVEEQFYFVWPLVVYFCSRRSLKAICIACIVGSLALRVGVWLAHQRPGAIYFPTPCRLDGLAMGSLAAILIRERGIESLARIARLGLIVGAISIAVIAIARRGIDFSDRITIVFVISAVNVLAASLLLRAIAPSSAVARIFNVAPLRTVGRYSYALYLIHVPFHDALSALISPERLSQRLHSAYAGAAAFVTLYAVASFMLAVLSWHLYEKHWLKLKRHFDYQPQPIAPPEQNDPMPMRQA